MHNMYRYMYMYNAAEVTYGNSPIGDLLSGGWRDGKHIIIIIIYMNFMLGTKYIHNLVRHVYPICMQYVSHKCISDILH